MSDFNGIVTDDGGEYPQELSGPSQRKSRGIPLGIYAPSWDGEAAYSTVTDFARFRGLSTSRPLATLT